MQRHSADPRVESRHHASQRGMLHAQLAQGHQCHESKGGELGFPLTEPGLLGPAIQAIFF